MRNVIIFFGAFFLLISGNVLGQQSLWKISKNGSTHHLLSNADYLHKSKNPTSKEIKAVYDSAILTILDVDPEIIKEGGKIEKMLASGKYKNNDSINNKVNKENLDDLIAEFEKGKKFAGINYNLKPYLQYLTLYKINNIRNKFVESIAYYHFYFAREKGKDYYWIEPTDSTIDKWFNVPERNQQQNEYLSYGIDQIQFREQNKERLKKEWQNGCDRLIKKRLKKIQKSYPNVYQNFIASRRSVVQKRMQRAFSNKNDHYLFIFSPYLIYGKNGILKQLKKQGFSITQL